METKVSYIVLLYILAKVNRISCLNDSVASTLVKEVSDLGHSGYVYLPSDQTSVDLEYPKCQLIDVNLTTCSFILKSPKDLRSIILMRAWTAVTLHDNIASIVGFLLHSENNSFPTEVYSSLTLVYQEIKRQNVKTLDLVSRVKSIAKSSSVSQIVLLFKSLRNVVPIYCRSAVDNLARIFYKRKDKLKTVLSQAIDQNEIRLFADIGMDIIPLLDYKDQSRTFNKRIAAVHGRQYAILFNVVSDARNHLSQPALAVLLLNTRFHELPPDIMEDLRFLADVLRLNAIKNWKINVKSKEPYGFIQSALRKVSLVPKIDRVIKDIVVKILPSLTKRSKTQTRKLYKQMQPFLGNSLFNTSLLFSQFSREVRIPEVEFFNEFVQKGNVDMAYALKGFIRHYYNTPNALRLAFLERIKNRVPMSDQVRESLDKVIVYLKIKDTPTFFQERINAEKEKREVGVNSSLGRQFLETYKREIISWRRSIDPAALPFYGESLENCFESMISIITRAGKNDSLLRIVSTQGLSSCLQASHGTPLSSWILSLDEPATDNINSIKDVSSILGLFLNDSEIKSYIKYYLVTGVQNNEVHRISKRSQARNNLYLSSNTNVGLRYKNRTFKPSTPIANGTHKDKNTALNVERKEQTTTTVKSVNGSKIEVSSEKTPARVNATVQNSQIVGEVETKRTQIVRILKDLLNHKKVRARPIVYYEIVRLYSALVHGIANYSNDALFLDSTLEDRPPNFLNSSIIPKPSLVVSNILDDESFIKNISSCLVNDYPSKRLFLCSVFKRMLTMEIVRSDSTLFNGVVRLLRSIQVLPIRLEELSKSLSVESLEEVSNLKIIVVFLTQPKLSVMLGDDFDVGLYQSKGSLLKAILERALNLTTGMSNEELTKTISKMIPKIDCAGVGSELVKTIESGATTDFVNFHKTMSGALDRGSITGDVERAFANMGTWYEGTFDPLKYVREMNVTLYETRAEFLEGFYDNVIKNIEARTAMMKKDIELMRSVIVKTGPGNEPVDYA